MFKNFRTMAAALLVGSAVATPQIADATGWPAGYQGVMLQGFYWDSYEATSWAKLEKSADELSKYFKLIWIPNSAKAEGAPTMGYHPVYWFTNHNSSFGTEAQLRSMIKTYKEKGTGFIADVVINHRSGVSNWTNFPEEKWNGKTYKIGPEGICSGDEVRNESGQAKPTGNPDTGENWDGARDLDHTNANVQANIKDYIKCLLTDFGYEGVRYDFVKGYAPQYTKIYNQANNVKYSVGEYWDGNYDAVKGWIDGTGKESAAFDFPCKYAINEAFATGDLTKLVWKANGTTDQPAGMIHFGYPQYAVTFIDNHDTYRDGSKFTGNVMAANAFILFSPGTPCIFWIHYTQNKAAMQTLINLRNACGISNTSSVKVLQSSRDCYMAEITGSKNKAVVKIGSAMVSPSGYTNADIKASGTDYCVWTKADAGEIGGGDVVDTPDEFYVIGAVNDNTWDPSKGVKMKKDGNIFTADIKVTGEEGNKGYFSFAKKLGKPEDWDAFNVPGNRYAPAEDTELQLDSPVALMESPNPTQAKAYYATNGEYVIQVDWKEGKITLKKGGSSAVTEIETGETDLTRWYTLQGVEVTEPKASGIYIRVKGKKAEKVAM